MNATIEQLSFDVFKNGKQVLNKNDYPLETTRGDTLSFKVKINDLTEPLETAYFTVKEDFNDLNAVFQLSLGNGINEDESEEGVYIVRVSPAFANLLDVGSYYYDLQIGVDGDIYTLFKGVLRVGYDVTKESVTTQLYDTSDATATAADVVPGKTAYVAGGKVTGTYNKLQKLIDRSITEISADDFAGITSIGYYSFYTSNIISATIPNQITEIGVGAFQLCRQLQYVDIGTGVQYIRSTAFSGSENLTYIVIRAITPPTLTTTDAFNNTNNCPIYVPAASVAAYKAATNWTTYANRIFAIEE